MPQPQRSVAICVEYNYLREEIFPSLTGYYYTVGDLKSRLQEKEGEFARAVFARIKHFALSLGEVADQRIFSKNAVRNLDDPSNRNPVPRIAKNYGYKHNPDRDKWRQVYAEYLEKELISYRPTHIAFLGSLGHGNSKSGGDDDNYTAMRSVFQRGIIPVYLTTMLALRKEKSEGGKGDHAINRILDLLEEYRGRIYSLDFHAFLDDSRD